MLKKILAHPLTRGLSLDSPETTALRRQIIKGKPFLRKLYQEWYERIIQEIPPENICAGKVLELGSGGGFIKDALPECVTSEVFPCPEVDRTLSAEALPFDDDSLRAIVMLDVLHHIPDVKSFFKEATRTLNSGGKIVMLEPWNTPWSRIVYTRLHHEPFLPELAQWELPILKDKNGPLSRANGALPWILFSRDSALFTEVFPQLEINIVSCDYPFSYLASGGVSMRSLAPGWSFSLCRAIERGLTPLMPTLAMFALITIQKTLPTNE